MTNSFSDAAFTEEQETLHFEVQLSSLCRMVFFFFLLFLFEFESEDSVSL